MNILNVVLSGIVSGIISYFSIINFSKRNFSMKNMIIYFFSLIPLLILSYIYFNGISRLILNVIFTIFALYVTEFKNDISNSVYYTVIYNIFSALGEILLSFIFVGLLKFDMNVYYNFSFSLFIFSTCNCLFVYFISKIKSLDKNL